LVRTLGRRTMKSIKTGLASRSLAALVAWALLWTLCIANIGGAQNYRTQRLGTIDAGTTITVRTNENISARDSDGRIFSGVVEQDVTNRNGYVAIPRGSDVELVVRRISDRDVALDMDSLIVNGQRFSVESEGSAFSAQRKEGLGVNDRTGKYVGGGAAIGAIIGAITGGGKGAAIGAGAGAAAGAGAQLLTRGRSVSVPAESLLTFRLAQPLRAGMVDNGYMNNGVHYHPGYATQPGYSTQQDAYNNGRQKPSYSTARGNVSIGRDNNIRWQGVENSTVFVQVDNEAPKLFAAATSGTQAAPWIVNGHVYVFILKDANGNEIARDQLDLRPVYPSRSRFRR